MLRTFVSACSYPSSPCFGWRSVAMLMLQLARKPRVMQRQERHFLQLPKIGADPHAADSHHRQNIHRVNSRTLRVERRHNQPVNINKTENDEHSGNQRQSRQFSFYTALHQQQKRQREMQHHQHDGHRSPTAESARHVPRNLFLQIARPDDQKLRIREVSPEHHEREHQIALVVELRGRHRISQWFVVGKPALHKNYEGHRRERRNNHENHAVNRRKPVHLERHHPIHRRKRQRQPPQNESRTAKGFEASFNRRVAGFILLPRPFIQYERQSNPDCKVNHCTYGKKSWIQVRPLVSDKRIGSYFCRLIPRIKPGESQQQRDEQNRHREQRPRPSFQKPPYRITPPATRQMMHHQNRLATQRNRKPINESK